MNDPFSSSDSLERNLPMIAADVLPYWSSEILAHWNMVDRLLIYMPVPFPLTQFEVPTGLEVPSLDWPINLVFGAGGTRWGRITGIGVGLSEGRGRQQIWRMDYHDAHPENDDLEYWTDKPFHYHVLGWNAGNE
jgi:hypothetical protein